MKKQITILSPFVALLFSVFILNTLTSCKTKQSTSTTYENTKDSTTIIKEQINALDSLKINDSTTIKITDEKVISSFSNGRTTEITLDSSALFTLASILDGTAYLPVLSVKITEANTSDLTTSKVITDKTTTKDITSVQSGSIQTTDSTNVNDSTITTIETSKSVSGGGFMWGIRVAIIIGVLLLLVFLYFRFIK